MHEKMVRQPFSHAAKRHIAFESTYFIVGDANGDGRINAVDVNMCASALSGGASDSSLDIDAGGNLNAIDLNLLCRMMTGTYTPTK